MNASQEEQQVATGPAGETRDLPAFDNLVAPVAVITADSTLVYVNAAAAHTVGQEPDWLVGRRMLELVHPDDRLRVHGELRQVAAGRPTGGSTTYRLRDPTRGWRLFECIADNLFADPAIRGILVSSRDITDQVAHQRALCAAAYRDSLTDLPNKAKIADTLSALITSDEPVAVGFLGIDRFKLINDSLGHTMGDIVLKTVAARLQACMPAACVLGRFGGDAFVVLIGGSASADSAEVLWRAVERVSEPMFVAGHELRVSLSAGFAPKDSAATAESLQRNAGLALHEAKSQGGGRVEPFRPQMGQAAIRRLELEADLRRGIARSEFSLALQPIVRLSDAEPVGAEALLRWQNAGSLTPAEFVAVAEDTGLIIPLGDWIIDEAVRHATGAPGGQVSVNLSAKQLASPGLVTRIGRVLAQRKVPASSVAFEITETLLIEQFDHTVQVLGGIRDLGCRIGLDDFGTGYSSLSYLRRLPIDFVKIDGSFSADIDTDRQGRAIVGAIIAMANAIGLDVIAEGVETDLQAAALIDLGCGYAQGYLFGRPTAT